MDCVDAHIVAAAVGGSASQLHIEPGESSVGGADGEPGRLGDDCLFRANSPSEQGAHAEALVLFVDDRGDEYLPLRFPAGAGCGCGAHRGQAALHVRRAAAVDPPAAEIGGERLVDHSLDADYIQVPVEHERRRVAWSHARNDVWTARSAIDEFNGKAPIVEQRSERASAITLARRVRSEGGISRVDLYQRAGECDRVATRYDHDLPSFRGLA